MSKKGVVAIDGPAGAGKSTIAKMLAQQLGYRYVDTGAMYRALTWKALKKNVPFSSPEELTKMAETTRLRFVRKKGLNHILVDNTDVTGLIRTQLVTKMTNTLAAIQGVRRVLRQLQREMGRQGGVVMEGRDIGTAVFPEAKYKFYLDASPLERAKRRYRELKAKNKRVSLRSIADAIRRRDYKDKTRGISPLKVAPGATVVDTTDMTLQEVAQFMTNIISPQ